MANEVKTIFTADASALFRVADEVEKRLKSAAGFAPNKTFSDAALKFAQRDIKQLEDSRIKSQKLIEKEIEKSERAIQAVRVREVKAANDAEIRELRRAEQVKNQIRLRTQFRQDLGDVLQQTGFNNAGSFIGASSGALAIGASIALISSGVQLAQTAIDKSIQAERANRLLASSATEAGKSYAFLAEQNRNFANSVGLSTVAAAEVTSKITQLATFSGNTSDQNIKNLQKGFADLSAARGIDTRQLGDLIGTILSGQDEGLNRLGLADPSKIYEAYARSVGKTADALTQYEKVQAAANAVLDKSKTFAGAADARMNSLEGTVAKTSASWENFTNSLARGFTQNLTIQSYFKGLSDSVKSLTKDTDTLLEKLRKGGTVSEDEIRAASAQSTFTRIFNIAGDALGAASTGILRLATLGTTFKETNESASQRLFENIFGYTDESRATELRGQLLNQILADAQQKKAAEDQRKANEEKINKANEEAAKNKIAVDTLKASLDYRAAATANFYKIEEAKLKAYYATAEGQEVEGLRRIGRLRDEAIKAEIRQTYELTNELIFSGKLSAQEQVAARTEAGAKMQELNAQLLLNQINTQAEIAAKEKEIYEKRKQQAKDLRDYLTSNFIQSSQNPFVRIFDDAGKAIERAKELTKGFSREIQNAAIASAQAANGGSLFGQRIESRLAVDSLQQQALKFLGGQRFITDYVRDFDAATGKLLSARSYQTIVGRSSFSNIFNDEQKKIQEDLRRQISLIQNTPFADIKGLSPADRSRFINTAIADLFKSINPADIDSNLRGQAAQALLRQASDKAREESEAAKFYQTMNRIINEQGLLVRGSTVDISVQSKDIDVTSQSNPARASRNDVSSAMQ